MENLIKSLKMFACLESFGISIFFYILDRAILSDKRIGFWIVEYIPNIQELSHSEVIFIKDNAILSQKGI